MKYHSFDTYEAMKSFMKAGLEEPQAEAITKAIMDSRDADISHLATKIDLKEEISEVRGEISEVKMEVAGVKAEVVAIKAELKADIAKGDSALATEIHKAKNQVLIWVVIAIFSVAGICTSGVIAAGIWALEHYALLK